MDTVNISQALAIWNGHSRGPQGTSMPWALLDRLQRQGLKSLVQEHEKQLVAMLLNDCRSLREAARRAHIDLKTLGCKITKFGLGLIGALASNWLMQ